MTSPPIFNGALNEGIHELTVDHVEVSAHHPFSQGREPLLELTRFRGHLVSAGLG